MTSCLVVWSHVAVSSYLQRGLYFNHTSCMAFEYRLSDVLISKKMFKKGQLNVRFPCILLSQTKYT